MGDVMKPDDAALPTDPKELRKFLKRVREGDESTLPAVRKLLQEPGAADRLGGNLAEHAEQALIRAATGEDILFREALTRKLALMRGELAGPDPTPLEHLLVSRVVACWLQVQDADVRYAQGQKNCTLALGEYQQRRQDRATSATCPLSKPWPWCESSPCPCCK